LGDIAANTALIGLITDRRGKAAGAREKPSGCVDPPFVPGETYSFSWLRLSAVACHAAFHD
jgi:hypothetical protein